ncbi:hypothetical protein [Catenovulum agarivorans]|uniref:hypothetical protein n=1 Tax=Catenovulum agarivorans TaxID=1172192 RepID=UPI0003615803|nr:hypothetical protein [Catenovulum agarivorans]
MEVNKQLKPTSTALLVLCFSATLAQNNQLRSSGLAGRYTPFKNMSNTWKPVDIKWLNNDLENQFWLLDEPQQKLWNLIKINPEKWSLSPLGDQGGGFYVVAVFGNQVLWFNDIEDGYNISNYNEYGVISDYFSNQNELHHSVNYLYSLLQDGV